MLPSFNRYTDNNFMHFLRILAATFLHLAPAIGILGFFIPVAVNGRF